MSEQNTLIAFDAIADFLIADRKVVDGLPTEDRRLAEIACLLAVDPCSPELEAAFREALQADSRPEILEAALIHAIGYLGIIVCRKGRRSLLRALTGKDMPTSLAGVVPVPTDRATRVESGARLYDRFDPGRQAKQATTFEVLSPIYYPRAMELSGLVLASPILALRERQIMTVAMLACLGGQSDQLRFHIDVALRYGVDQTTLAGILILVQAYAGMPRANSAAQLALKVLKERDAKGEELQQID
jgi:4-carboxymuconolactone decarboxylase